MMHNVPDYIYFKDMEGRFTRVNRAFANQFGNCEPEDIVGKSDFDFLGIEAARESRQDEEQVIATGLPILGKEEHEIWLDSREWWVLTSKMPFRDENGKVIGICGITRDITQRKKAEAALQAAHAHLEKRVQERTIELTEANKRLLGEIVERKQAELRSSSFSNLGYWLGQARNRQDAAQIILEVADQLLGWEAAYLHLYTPDHGRVIPVLAVDLVEGKRVSSTNYLVDEQLSERDKRIISEGAELLLRSEDDFGSAKFSKFGDKDRTSKSLMFVPIRNGARVVGALSIQSYLVNAYSDRDLETLQALADFCAGALERIQAEEALRKSEERFSKAFMSSPVPMTLSTLREGRYLDVNESMLQLVGFTRAEMLGKTSVELGIWPDPSERARMVDSVMKNRSLREVEFCIRTKSGQIRTTLLSVELMDFGTEPIVLVSVHDITERRSLEERLRHSQKMEAIGQLAAGVAHDFNNILTIIQGHTSLLLEQDALAAVTQEALKQVDLAAERAANLTKQLLAFSRKQVMQPRLIDLNEVVANTSRMLHRSLGENVSLHFNYTPGTAKVHADPGMIEQVIVNLAVNARDAMPNGGKLVLSTESLSIDEADVRGRPEARVGRFVRITCEDTGCGIPPELIGRIFEPFFTTKEVGKGTGLGLSTVYGIVQQHHGWVEVVSTLGSGSAFKIYLPAVQQQTNPLLSSSTPIHDVAGGHETILIVEDEPALRSLIQTILEMYGYKVLTASNGNEALKVWDMNKDTIDLLLTDVVMPEGISGLKLAEALKADCPELKVIFTSGYNMEIFGSAQGIGDGGHFISKPYQPRVLAKVIRDALS
ncbi:MAG: PAS domain S-box protein [Limisphaerales bacterium]